LLFGAIHIVAANKGDCAYAGSCGSDTSSTIRAGSTPS
jgi:hypothetical protein